MAARLGRKIYTEIVPAARFYPAEDYHQKYLLRNETALLKEFRTFYPSGEAFVASTAAARVNGYLSGEGTAAQLEQELAMLGLSASAGERLRKRVLSP